MDSREPIEDHELAAEIEAAIEAYHDAMPQGQGEWGDPLAAEEAAKVMARLLYNNSDTILEALRRPSPVAESTPTDATVVEAERDGDKCACFCPTDECQRVCTLDCLNAGARIPPRQADMADAQKAENTPSPDTEGEG